VENFFTIEKPEYVFLAAAKVGGIYANSTYPAEFIYDNLMIECNVIHASYQNKVRKLLFLGSSCIYPKLSPQPIKEEYLLSGYLEPTNEAYAIAKISGIELCKFYREQYGCDFISVMPTNLYGPNDNFHPENSHVLPALIRKFHEAKINNYDKVVVWGTGKARREFLYVDDLAEACIFLMKEYSGETHLNIGTGMDLEIKELAEIIKNIVNYKGEIVYDFLKPDGTPQKLLDVSKINKIGWKAKTDLLDGITKTYQWYVNNEKCLS
jgi:GDP-L-fucose synthase